MNVPVRLRGAPLMALSSLFFAAMATLVRAASGSLNAGQLVAGRFLIGLGVATAIFLCTRSRPAIPRPWLWAQRGLLGGGAVYFYFYAIEHLEVGPATVLNYTHPVYAALFGVLFLKETPTRRLWAGLFIATVGGVVVVLGSMRGPGGLELSAGAWAGLLSAVLSGGAVTTIRALRRDTGATTVFASFSLFGILWSLPFAATTYRPLQSAEVLAVVLVGLLAAAAQLLMTYAYGYVTASAGSVWTQFTPALSWGLAVVFLGERPSLLATAGAVICVVGVLFGTGMIGPQLRTGNSSGR